MGLSEIDRSFARLGEESCRPSTPAGKLLVPETASPAVGPIDLSLPLVALRAPELVRVFALH